MTEDAAFRIEISPHAVGYDCRPDETLLTAALAAGLALPHSCRNGTCRSCIVKLVEGRIEHCIKWPGLSFDEKKEGWILPCVACPRSALVIEQPKPVPAATKAA